jgi:hypothetical protein
MYPRNAASPERIAIGPVVQVSDGAVQTSGVSVKVMPQGGSASAGGGTVAYEEGVVLYTPTQAETNYASFIVIAYKSGCIPVAQTVVTSKSATTGYAGVDWSQVTGASSTVNLSGTTIKTATDVETDTADIQSKIGSPAGASVSADIAAVKSQTAAIETDTQDIQSRLPAALVSGRIDASVGAMEANVLTASAINSGAITAAKFASGAIDAAAVAADAWQELIEQLFTYDATATYATADAGSLVAQIADNAGGSSLTAADIADAVWDEAISGHLTAGSTGNALNAAGSAGDPWSTPLPGAYGAGTAGKIIGDNLNAPVGTVDSVVDAIKAVTDNLPNSGALTSLATAADLTTVDTVVDAIKAKTDNLPASPAATGDIPTEAAIADAVWDEAIAGHNSAGSTGEALAAAGGAGDPWITALPGSYTSGQAGHILGTYLDAAISSRSTYAGADTAGTTTLLSRLTATRAGYLDNLSGGAVALASSILDASGIRAALGLASANLDTQLGALPTANENADALLERNVAGGSSTGRKVKEALYFLRNRWTVSGGNLVVYGVDDTTSAWTAVVSQSAGDPVSEVNPA